MRNKVFKQGDMWMYHSDDTIGSEQSAIDGRCCLIVQSDIGNKCSPTTIICPLTKRTKKYLPQHYQLKREDYDFLSYDSLVLNEQVRCIDSVRLERKLGKISKEDLDNIIEKVKENF